MAIEKLSYEYKREDFFVELIKHLENKIKWGKSHIQYRGNEEEYLNDKKEKIKFCQEALSALKKQIPKKPIGDLHTVPHYRCPNCKCSVKSFKKDEVFPFCGFCGQALDWSETSENDGARNNRIGKNYKC